MNTDFNEWKKQKIDELTESKGLLNEKKRHIAAWRTVFNDLIKESVSDLLPYKEEVLEMVKSVDKLEAKINNLEEFIVEAELVIGVIVTH